MLTTGKGTHYCQHCGFDMKAREERECSACDGDMCEAKVRVTRSISHRKRCEGKAKLAPPDIKQCQAEKPNGYSFMTLGGRPGRERCTTLPAFIVSEKAPGKDMQTGSMSICISCLCVMNEQMKLGDYDLTPIVAHKLVKKVSP
jgi:hypothetical protein